MTTPNADPRTVTLPGKTHDRMAADLFTAWKTGNPIAPLSDSEPGMTMADGYEVQQRIVKRLLGDGDSIVGYKLGLTSKPMQEMLKVDSPDLAPVMASHLLVDGADIAVSRFIAPRMEAEIAFVLSQDVGGPNVTAAQVMRSTAGICASLEIVDSRVADWKIKLPDTVADMASCGAIVMSGHIVPIEGFDVRLVGMTFSRSGEVIATGAGAAALGNPAEAIAWLARTLHPQGVTLKAGHIIMTGALHAAVPVVAGEVYRADFDRLGPVTARMV